MGITTIRATIANLDDPKVKLSDTFMVDTGASYTLVPYDIARKLRLKTRKTQEFVLADGTTARRKLGFAMVAIDGESAPSTVVIGEKGDSPLIGVLTLEGMGLMVDPFKRKLRPMRLMLS